MGLKFSFHGRPVRNPVIRVAAIILTLLVAVAMLAIGAFLVVPLIVLTVLASLVWAFTGGWRRRVQAQPHAVPRPPPSGAPIDEEARLARAKPVERV